MIISSAYAAESVEHETTAETVEMTTTQAHEAAASGGVSGGLQALGLDGKLLAAQIVNFIVLLLILRQFVYKPLMALLEKRRTDIETGLKQADEIKERYQEFQVEHAQRIEESKTEASAVIEKAKQAAEELRNEMLAATKAETEKMLTRTHDEIAREKDKMLGEVKQEVGRLVIAATEKIISKEIDEKIQDRLIDEVVDEVK